MGHVWCLLVAQIDRDRQTVEAISRHIDAYITEHIRKGWLEYNSPCYVEKDVGCLIMLAKWADDPLLRKKATVALDVLFAEHAILNLEGMLCGPACRVYRAGNEGILPLELGAQQPLRCEVQRQLSDDVHALRPGPAALLRRARSSVARNKQLCASGGGPEAGDRRRSARLIRVQGAPAGTCQQAFPQRP